MSISSVLHTFDGLQEKFLFTNDVSCLKFSQTSGPVFRGQFRTFRFNLGGM